MGNTWPQGAQGPGPGPARRGWDRVGQVVVHAPGRARARAHGPMGPKGPGPALGPPVAMYCLCLGLVGCIFVLVSYYVRISFVLLLLYYVRISFVLF